MEIELRIRWDGELRGLSEHRLSLALMGPALAELVRAIRRTGSNLLSKAFDSSELGARGGRLNKLADGLDLELKGVSPGCANVSFVCTFTPPPGEQYPLVNGINERACLTLVSDIEGEQAGKATSSVARAFLRAVPDGVRRQRYAVVVDGEEKKVVEFGEAQLPELPEPLPGLSRLEGRVVAVGFEPGRTFVSVKGEGGSLSCSATRDQVEEALRLRGQPIEAMALTKDGKSRLLWLRAQGERRGDDVDARTNFMFERWGELLGRLAK